MLTAIDKETGHSVIGLDSVSHHGQTTQSRQKTGNSKSRGKTGNKSGSHKTKGRKQIGCDHASAGVCQAGDEGARQRSYGARLPQGFDYHV